MKKTSNHLLTRRSTLTALATAGVAGFFIPAWNETVEAADSITCVPATPTVTEGPYWVDEKLFRSDIRTDPSTGTPRAGIPLTLRITVQNLSTGGCVPLAGAYVDVWHCDAKGIYSDEGTYNPGGGTGTVNTSGQKFLRGYQITDDSGAVQFTTIYPGWYSGRTIHIHFRVRTYNGSTVIGNFVSQIFFDESINNTVLATSAYSRTTARDTTNASDMVYRVPNQERMLATTTGDVNSGYTSNITVGVTLQTPAASAPTVGGVANAMNGAVGVAPSTWISLYGTGLSTTTRTVATADLVSGKLPTTLGGVSVQINGKAAFIHYLSATQVNVLAPDDTATGNVTVSLTNANGTSSNFNTTESAVLPGLATQSNYVRAVRYPDGAIINGTGSAESGYAVSAAVGQSDIVSLFGTGFGLVSSPPSTGTVFTGAYPTTNAVTVTIGGVQAEVLWAGLVAAGLYQINVRVPAEVGDGDQVVVARVNGVGTTGTALIKVSAAAKLKEEISTARLMRRLMNSAEAYNGALPTSLRAGFTIERLTWLAGLPPHRQTAGCLVDDKAHAAVRHAGSIVQLA